MIIEVLLFLFIFLAKPTPVAVENNEVKEAEDRSEKCDPEDLTWTLSKDLLTTPLFKVVVCDFRVQSQKR